MAQQKETERVREIFDASAAHYDRGMAFSEKLFFGDGRAWACSQARGQVLEIAIGTGRNLPFYPAAVEITGIELSPAMLEIAGLRAQSLVDRSSWSSGMRRRSPSPISASIQWCARFRCAAFPTNDRPSQRCGAFCVQAAASWPSNTCAVQTPSSADLSACSTPTRCVLRQITCYVSQSKPCRRQVLASTISNGRNWASSSA